MRSGRGDAIRIALVTLVATRLAVWAVALWAGLTAQRNELAARYFDLPQFTQPFGWDVLNSVFGALSRWDAVWYLMIAGNGYNGPDGLPAAAGANQWGVSVVFFPGYPLLVRVASGFADSAGARIVAAFALSLLAYGAALYLLYRLTDLELGPRVATWAVALLAVFPGALFLGVPYSESAFLFFSIASFVAARRERWALAGGFGAAAAVTRFAGIALIVPLVFLYLDAQGRRVRADAAWLLLVPLASLIYLGYAGHLTHDPLGYFHTGRAYGRATADPFTLLWHSLEAGGEGFGRLYLGLGRDHITAPRAMLDLSGLVAFAAAAALTVSAWRNLPRAYGAYAAVALIFILYAGPRPHPLESALRYLVVVFPLFMELARLVAGRARAALALAGAFAASLLGVTIQFSRWWFVG